jgi:hypothetical protein
VGGRPRISRGPIGASRTTAKDSRPLADSLRTPACRTMRQVGPACRADLQLPAPWIAQVSPGRRDYLLTDDRHSPPREWVARRAVGWP